MVTKKEKDKTNYKKYAGKLEKAWRKDWQEKEDRLYDWVDTAFDREEVIKQKDKLATKLFLLGFLLGALFMNLLLMIWIFA
jgi:hypothetical protein